MKLLNRFVLIFISILLINCPLKKGLTNNVKANYEMDKINFDISQISPDGLIGHPDGLRSVSYEFCIPATEQAVKTIQTIDPTISLMSKSPGRISCQKNQYLCIGQTHNPKWKDILFAIANLDYVEKIAQFYGE